MDYEGRFVVEVEPGVGVGPVRLGMVESDVVTALASRKVEHPPITAAGRRSTGTATRCRSPWTPPEEQRRWCAVAHPSVCLTGWTCSEPPPMRSSHGCRAWVMGTKTRKASRTRFLRNVWPSGARAFLATSGNPRSTTSSRGQVVGHRKHVGSRRIGRDRRARRIAVKALLHPVARQWTGSLLLNLKRFLSRPLSRGGFRRRSRRAVPARLRISATAVSSG